MKIVLDAGHGLNTPGKRTPCGMREWEFNNKVANYVADELKDYENVQGVMRVDDVSGKVDVPLPARTKAANDWEADCYVSIHANAFGTGGWTSGNGIETYTHPQASRASVALAKLVQDELVKATKRSDRGIKTANFQVLRETKMTAILAECGFMTHREEAELLKSDAYRKLCASAIVRGLVSMYGLKKKPKPIEAEGPIYRVIVDGKQLFALRDKQNIIRQLDEHIGKAKKIELERI